MNKAISRRCQCRATKWLTYEGVVRWPQGFPRACVFLGHARQPCSTSRTIEDMLSSSGIAFVGAMLGIGAPRDTIPSPVLADTLPRIVAQSDTQVAVTDSTDSGADRALRRSNVSLQPLLSDTIPRRRASVAYSDAYGTRATIHRRLSYAMVPLFALSYFTGDKLFKEGQSAPSWVLNTHRASATSAAVLFTANTITGGWNMWEARHDPINRKRRYLHSALFIAASAGFTYSGAVLAEQAERSESKRRDHRTLNLVSMGLSASSVLVMLTGRK